MKKESKRLYRSRTDRVLAGVCGGLGEYLDVDPVLLRVAWVAMVLIGGFGILLYLFWIFIVPLRPMGSEPPKPKRGNGSFGVVLGSILIFLGFVFLADEWSWIDLRWWGHWSWNYLGPVMLMGAGVWFLVRSRDQNASDSPSESEDAPRASRSAGSQSGRFVRGRRDRKVFGVCSGLASYMGIDPTIARLLFGFVTLMNPPVGIIMYLALAAFTPSEPAAEGHMGAQAT